CRHNLATVYMFTGRGDEAEKLLLQASAARERLAAEHPNLAAYQAAWAEDLNSLALIYSHSGRGDQAQAAYERVLAILDPLIRKFPDERRYATSAAAAHLNLGELLRGCGRPGEGLAHQDRAIALLRTVLDTSPLDGPARGLLLSATGARALALRQMGRAADAVAAWDKVLELAPEAERRRYRLMRAPVLAAAGDHAGAAAETGALAALARVTDDDLYPLAGVYAQAIPAVRKDVRLSPAEQEKLAEQYANAALSLLDRLERAGYFKTTQRRGHPSKTDPDPETPRPPAGGPKPPAMRSKAASPPRAFCF